MEQRIISVDELSPASKAGLDSGWTLVAINGSPVWDVIDYEQLTASSELTLDVKSPEGKRIQGRI